MFHSCGRCRQFKVEAWHWTGAVGKIVPRNISRLVSDCNSTLLRLSSGTLPPKYPASAISRKNVTPY